MKDTTENAPLAQHVSYVNEWLGVLSGATKRGLIAPAEAAQIEGNYLIGLLALDGLRDRIFEALRAGPAAEMALDAIVPAYAPGDVIELRALDPAGGGGLSLCGRLDDPAERAALVAFVRNHNGRRNLYVGCNPRRADMAGTAQAASAADVPVRRNVVLDFDIKDAPSVDPDFQRTLDALRTKLDPLMIVNSGNGYHVWLPIEPMSGPDLDVSAGPLATAMARIGADNLADLPRIVRLPFTLNLPSPSKRARGATVRLAATC
jgi:hypothetical protein